MQALETSYHVWRDSKDRSIEAFRASEALAVILRKVRSEDQGEPGDASHEAVDPLRGGEDGNNVPPAEFAFFFNKKKS